MTEDELTELARKGQMAKREIKGGKEALVELYKQFNKREDAMWIVQWKLAEILFDRIAELKPKKILDLGTGIGVAAAIMALASPDSEIHTVEQFEKVSKLAEKAVPKELQKNMTFHVSPSEVWLTDYAPYHALSIYSELPDKDWDFVFVDGPGPFREKFNGEYVSVELPNGDVLKMLIEEKLKPGALIGFDKRVAAVRTLERYVGENFYRLEYLPNPEGWLLIQKKDPKEIKEKYGAEIHFKDAEYEGMNKHGYWENT